MEKNRINYTPEQLKALMAADVDMSNQNINESIKQLSSIDDEDVKTFLKELSEIESESDLENLVVKYTKKQQEIVEQIEKAHKYCNELLQNID